MSKYYDGLTGADRVREVYSTSANLDAKYGVMREHGIASETFESWLLRRLALTGSERVLDVGCGQGRFLLPVARTSTTGVVVGCDIAPGVMIDLGRTIQAARLPALLVVGDAQALPFLDGSFDLVLANHMLYHVADIPRAAIEAARVLRPGGTFVATTNGRDGMKEMHDLHVATMAELEIDYDPHVEHLFDLEGGAAELERAFPELEVWRFEDGFRSPTAGPVTEYYMATQPFQGPVNDPTIPSGKRRVIEATYQRLAEHAIGVCNGQLVVSKPVGAFVGRKPSG